MFVRKVIVWCIQKTYHQPAEYSMAYFDLSKAKPRKRTIVLITVSGVPFGFGASLLLVLAIPLFQFLCIPLGVVGGTRICFDAKSPMVVEK